MSITGTLQQISSYLLTKLNEHRSLLDLFLESAPLDEDPKIENLHGLSSERTNLLNSLLSNPEQVLGKWTLRDLETLEDWKSFYPEDFDDLKAELYQIFIEIRAVPILDLERGWEIVSYIFAGSSSRDKLPFLVNRTESNLRVNAILCGQRLDEDGYFNYLETNQVREIANALSTFPQEIIRQRFEQQMRIQSNICSSTEESYEELVNFCFEVRDFYTSAANQENAMLISIV